MTNRQRVFVEEYLRCWNASEAARRAGYAHPYKQGPRLLENVGISEAINQRLDGMQMDTNEILAGLTEQARGDLGVFFKLVEEWTFYPLPSYDIIGQKEVEILDEDCKPTGEKKISYWCRHVTIDMDKLIDPRYSHLVHKFTDSPKNGLGIELYDKQSALSILSKIRGLQRDNLDITSKGEPLIIRVIYDDKNVDNG